MTPHDPESRRWLHDLRGGGAVHDDAVRRLHALLLRAARFEVGRRREALAHVRGDELEDIATQAADDALMSVLRRLDDFRGDSRFTTWAYKFALLESAVKLRRRAWQGREVPMEPESWTLLAAQQPTPHEDAVQAEVLGAVGRAIREALTPAPARGARRARAQRGSDRRARPAPRLDARRPLQDPARRAPQAARGAHRRGHRPRLAGKDELMDRPDVMEALERLLGPAGPEIGCDECFDELDRYVDLELAGRDADGAVPGMSAHLAGCPACREEHASLRALVAR